MDRQPRSRTYPQFDRKFFASDEDFTVIGSGELGGKALGLAAAKRILSDAGFDGASAEVDDAGDGFAGAGAEHGGADPGFDEAQGGPGASDSGADHAAAGLRVGIPRLTVIGTDVFERFMAHNGLYDIALSDAPDDRIAHAFVAADIPATIVGDLRALTEEVHTPLAVRSSSMLEDALHNPFAGVYATKMVPNDDPFADERFRRLTGAVKLVWASTFFRGAKSYMREIDRAIAEERMAVIIQEVVGERYGDRFYPIVSGVLRTHNYYPTGSARAEDGVVNLALGLGKAIVDGGVSWSYSPPHPKRRPPFGSTRELLAGTQTRFWAIDMRAPSYDPIRESECLVEEGLDAAESDDTLRFVASTYDAASDRLTIGTGVPGPRALTFARILELGDVPLNDLLRRLGAHCKEALDAEVEIEFAVTFDRRHGLPGRFGFLQVRPLMVSRDPIEVSDADVASERAIVASDTALGNGVERSLRDVVYVRPDAFEGKHTRRIAEEIEAFNHELAGQQRRYVLIGFGRWGSSDPWLGIPVTWPQISAARVIVEATLPAMNVDASQGSHFFHNLTSFRVLYFMVRHDGPHAISWGWLERQPAAAETPFVRHVRLERPLQVRVDGRDGRGVILRG